MKRASKKKPAPTFGAEKPIKTAAALISDQPVTAKVEAEDTSWKTDPFLRALACRLAYDSGWVVPPSELGWAYIKDSDLVTVQRPAGIQSSVMSANGSVSMARASFGDAQWIIDELGRRLGAACARQVELFAFPERETAPVTTLLPCGAQYLRQLARQMAGAPADQIEAGLVDVVRTCAELARESNNGDQSPSASHTRATAGARIMQLISPGRPQ